MSFITAKFTSYPGTDPNPDCHEVEEFVLRAEQRFRDHDEFIPFGLFTFLSVIWYLAKYFKPGVFVAIFVEKNTVKMM